jgi:hypothetical protein
MYCSVDDIRARIGRLSISKLDLFETTKIEKIWCISSLFYQLFFILLFKTNISIIIPKNPVTFADRMRGCPTIG